MKKLFNYFIISLLLFHVFAFVACSPKFGQFIPGILSDGKYDSEFPSRSSSDYLEKLSDPVKMINTIAYYEGYFFSENEKVTMPDILAGGYSSKSDTTLSFHNSSSGTATVIYSQSKKVAILTSAHVMDHPDTLITYYNIDDTDSTQIIESFCLKKKQRNILIGITEGAGFEVLAFDPYLDLAVLGKELVYPPDPKIPVFNSPLGSAKDLQWGSFVYMIGWPKGNKMVTRGIVSSPNRDRKHSFLIDALFNRGFSGGIVLVIRDGVPNFELVGIVSSVSASFEQILVPEVDADGSKFDPKLPYTNQIYVKNQQQIDYGITYAVSIENIQKFLNNHKNSLEDRGYYFDRFFHE